ncbi:type 2 isopentenyl-diphosphate Delta-isomerase [Staphylococcus delphini]|uniref:type 2 isopentenyl-diphosphate Delta-isomerase n=1 Tax=Staphylococcus delphini TaxID=53344 RepID=UPI0023B31094|nr:type 2 isopentenyl-diphosphate Delta-isomerase [Staphylococcus delphini]MDE9752580.1 type 2 isopentenyl-diphosphate Delta-isomerase [Staphylococcus delphini]MDE9790559.1 type 2 isopentenyl-diphosphate Delta-isomerase [Staphylococcus delphini]MDE9791630.1 type 2 isopentenyl-diphosphate Delta-isomerase [Staphylococcus delphini]MDE9794770.1 type 2 isopentenyl-diphosphate Delta-isomerase [Staphylococcus delphini]MDE9796955.1 type 2 isopentenyl-diphosphate Delta-isomerase [Staphylococcus delphin
MTNKREQRKNEHVRLALAQSDTLQSDFDRIQFVHHAIPEMDVEEVTLLPNFKALQMSHVLYINAMTGGSEWTAKTNEQLAQVAKATQIPMAVGSMHAALKNPAVRHSYAVARDQYPEGQIWANVSADVTLEEAQAAIEMIQANALQIHVNAPQELVMPEGNRQFKHWLTRISEIVKGVKVPVIVKEVGFGMSYDTIQQLIDAGVSYVDISGHGGTNFITIENERRQFKDMDYLKDWGQSTVVSLLEARNLSSRVHVLASGGVRHPLDAIKALRLGAEAVGMSRPILKMLHEEGVEATIEYVEDFKTQMAYIMTLLNAKNITELRQAAIVFDPYLKNWIQQRQL